MKPLTVSWHLIVEVLTYLVVLVTPYQKVTVSLLVQKKHRATIVDGLTWLWDSKVTVSMIKRRHTKHNESKIRYNKVEQSTAYGVYYTTHYVKVPFCMPEFSSSKIINHRFYIDNDKGESGIAYDMIIVRDRMVQLGLKVGFKHQVLQ